MKEKILDIVISACIGLFILSAAGCTTPTRYARTTNRHPECPTSVSGYMHYPLIYAFKTPALIIKKAGVYKALHGVIVEKTNDGYIFDAQKSDNWDAPPRLYKIDDIICLLDSNANVLYGNVPQSLIKTWDLRLGLVPVNDKDQQPVILRIKYNEPFSFCVEPGCYYVKNFVFTKSDNYSDISISIPKIRVDVLPGIDNYIGDIYIDENNDSCSIICRPDKRPLDEIGYGLINEIGKSLEKDIKHTIVIKNELIPSETRRASIMKILSVFEK